jgi:DNA-binding IclR family transcriptional regulator
MSPICVILAREPARSRRPTERQLKRLTSYALNNLFLLHKHGPQTSRELANGSFYAPATVSAGMTQLHREGLVTWNANTSVYTITAAGLAVLESERNR